MELKEFYAHSLENKPYQEWHRLEEHLSATANLASKYADEFGSGRWAYLAGLWHDLGRALNGFLC